MPESATKSDLLRRRAALLRELADVDEELALIELAPVNVEMLTVEQWARIYQYAPSTVRAWCIAGQIDGAQQTAGGGPWRIPRTSKPPSGVGRPRKRGT